MLVLLLHNTAIQKSQKAKPTARTPGTPQAGPELPKSPERHHSWVHWKRRLRAHLPDVPITVPTLGRGGLPGPRSQKTQRVAARVGQSHAACEVGDRRTWALQLLWGTRGAEKLLHVVVFQDMRWQ